MDEKVTADAGYESPETDLFLAQNGPIRLIKPANYEARKTKKFKRNVIDTPHSGECQSAIQSSRISRTIFFIVRILLPSTYW